MKTKEIVLEFESVKYYSFLDEDAFFYYLKKMKCITNVKGIYKTLYVHVNPELVTLQDMLSFIGLFRRYKINLFDQLAQFSPYLSEEDRKMFENKKAYWYKKVFKNKKNN